MWHKPHWTYIQARSVSRPYEHQGTMGTLAAAWPVLGRAASVDARGAVRSGRGPRLLPDARRSPLGSDRLGPALPAR